MLTIEDSNNDVEKLGIPQLTQCHDIFGLFNALYTGDVICMHSAWYH